MTAAVALAIDGVEIEATVVPLPWMDATVECAPVAAIETFEIVADVVAAATLPFADG